SESRKTVSATVISGGAHVRSKDERQSRLSRPIGAFFLLSAPKTLAGDAVDLRGKQGIPRDLKGNNPPERSLHTIEPPSPSVGDLRCGSQTTVLINRENVPCTSSPRLLS